MKKKILIVYSGAKYFGGIETYLKNLFELYDRKKAELVLVSLGDWELTKIIEKSDHKTFILPRQRLKIKNVKEIATIAQKEKVDLIVSQGVVANFYGRLAAKRANLPELTVVHSDIDFDYPVSSKKLLYKLSDRALIKETKRIIAVSNHLKKTLVKRGIPEEKITVIYNGMKNTAPAIKKPGKEIILGSIGRLHQVKGYHNLIQAMGFLQNLPVKLIIWGEGEEKEGLINLISREGLKDKVNLAGFEKNRHQIFNQIDIYIQPSLSEGFSLTVAEAMLSKKPIIVTPVGSLPELIKDGKTGIITGDTNPEALAAAIKVLVGNKKLSPELAVAARTEATKRFSIEKWTQKTIDIFLETAK